MQSGKHLNRRIRVGLVTFCARPDAFCINIMLKPQAESLLFAAVLLLLQPIQIEEVNLVFQIGGLRPTGAR